MRAFAHNTYDDYYENAMADFPWPSRLLFDVVCIACGLFTKIVWPWRFENTGELWNNDGQGRVIVCNHVSMLEPVITLVSLRSHGIHCRAIYKSEFDDIKIAKWLFSRIGAIPVERGTADIKCVRRAERALKRGECVLIYPEGTRIRTDDQPVEIHGGFALIARMAKAPVIPLAVVGARDITRQGSRLKRIFWRVYLRAGEPLRFEDMTAENKKARTEELEQRTMESVYALREQLRAEHPGKH